jgi:hypothetical protein
MVGSEKVEVINARAVQAAGRQASLQCTCQSASDDTNF